MNIGTATIIGALIGAVAVIGAGYMDYIKPSERQVDNSEQYKKLVDENAGKIVELGWLRQEVSTLRSENQRLTDLAAKSDTEARQIRKNLEEVRDEQADLKQSRARAAVANSSPQTPAEIIPLSSIAPVPHRVTKRELTLATGDAMRVRADLTITLQYVKSYGASLVINGERYGSKKIGSRIPLSVRSQEKCFLEIISYTGEQVTPGKVRADLVCEPKDA